MTDKSPVEIEIDKQIKRRHFYSRFDFILNHVLLLIMVCASGYPAYAQIMGNSDEKYIALIAAIPAFVLLIQRTFKWEQRGEWQWNYRRRLIAIQREMRDQGLSPEEASKKLTELETDLSGTFPSPQAPAGEDKG